MLKSSPKHDSNEQNLPFVSAEVDIEVVSRQNKINHHHREGARLVLPPHLNQRVQNLSWSTRNETHLSVLHHASVHINQLLRSISSRTQVLVSSITTVRTASHARDKASHEATELV